MTTNRLIDFANNHYNYETEHIDAADAYSVIFEGRGVADFHCEFRTENPYKGLDSEPFDDDSNVLDYIYLGQEEMEIQLPEPVENEEQVREFDFAGFTAFNGSDLVYALYPDNLFVVAVAD